MDKTTICLNGTIRVGDIVVVTPNDDYCALIGCVTGIYYAGTPEHDEMTNNATDNVLVDFSNDYSDQRIAVIETQFRDLYDDDEKAFDELPIDSVVMAPCALLKIDPDKVGKDYFNALLDSEARTAEWCFNELLNFINSQPKKTTYEVAVSYRFKGETFNQETDFNTECAAYDFVCRKYVEMIEKFSELPNAYNSTVEREKSFFFAGGAQTGNDQSDCYAVRMNRISLD